MAANRPVPATSPDTAARARRLLERCDLLATFSEEPGRLTRRYGTAALAAAQAAVTDWMTAAGLEVRRDAVGNLIGRYAADRPDAPTLLLGSHLDSVRDAGRYDGPLGVLVALAAVERLHSAGERLPFAIEVVAFADEEGLRFHTAYLGSRGFVGALDPTWLDLVDDADVTLAAAVRDFGGDPDALRAGGPPRQDLLGYVEVHIEQGPTLEALGLPVGVVTAIAAQSRLAVAFTGVAGHAGTVAMPLRRDALCAAAEFVLAVEATASRTDGLVATVGQIAAEPGASNVIPGAVRLSLDVRHPTEAERDAAVHALREQAEAIAGRRRVSLAWDVVQHNPAVACDPALADRLAEAVGRTGTTAHRLPSGAGHDGVTLSTIAPFAMLFVRCGGGVSHNPAESITAADVAVAIAVIDGFLALLRGLPRLGG